MGGAPLVGESGKVSLRRWLLSLELKDVKELARLTVEQRAFWAQEVACAKALGQPV